MASHAADALSQRGVRHRVVLLFSIGLIGAFWASIATHHALHLSLGVPEEGSVGVRAIASWVVRMTVVEAAILWLLLRGGGERFATLGVSIGDVGRALRTPAVYRAVGALLLVTFVVGSLDIRPAGAPRAQDPAVPAVLAGWLREPHGVLWMLLLSIVGGGFREELERAFCLTRFEQAFGRTGLVLAVGVDAVLFGAQHLYQGRRQAVAAGVLGLLMALVFLRRRRAADAMVAHAAFDVVMVLLASTVVT
jgi:membrane protease YdiL (CAAX protease family)